LKSWIEKGNVLIGLGSGGAWFADKDAALTTAAVVGADEKPGESKPAEKKADGATKPKKPQPVPGAIFRAKLNPEHFLCFGYDRDEIAVPVSGATFFKKSQKGANPVTFGK